ncbi:hypothetical protein Acr_00g0069150 [Actinidia rufa]|uniref:Uncharacterized protein n=1 Tax=Actinidia rufa TaxID=165716 RepID=A0A7J0DSP5_9ERIC|nr:hypothetical protein Acr_00g0069150 [Actinidia rufa]
MEDQNEEGRVPNFAPQNSNAMLNPPMGGVPQNPPLNPAHGLGGDIMEDGSIHGDIGAPQFRTLRDYMNPPRQAPSSCIVFPPHYATLNIRLGGVNSRVDKTLDDIKSQLILLTQALTLTEKGKLPAQSQPNSSRHVHSIEISNQPSSGHEQVQAITVLRSGKTIDKTILPINPKGRGDTSKVVEGTVGGDRETSEKKESEGVPREEENRNEKGNNERKEKSGLVPKSEEVLREERGIFALISKLDLSSNVRLR